MHCFPATVIHSILFMYMCRRNEVCQDSGRALLSFHRMSHLQLLKCLISGAVCSGAGFSCITNPLAMNKFA